MVDQESCQIRNTVGWGGQIPRWICLKLFWWVWAATCI